uniref:Uncharacterized protein n=1 Tax=Candidatus Nitrotoga fabula TaxID=2182327 RepID=A0A2X0QUH7_9PROT|nr:protein of unknown function [Candidatus Nitrotoga fabula]
MEYQCDSDGAGLAVYFASAVTEREGLGPHIQEERYYLLMTSRVLAAKCTLAAYICWYICWLYFNL